MLGYDNVAHSIYLHLCLDRQTCLHSRYTLARLHRVGTSTAATSFSDFWMCLSSECNKNSRENSHALELSNQRTSRLKSTRRSYVLV